MLFWRRMVMVVVVMAGVMALWAAEEPRPAAVVEAPHAGQESGIRSQESGGREQEPGSTKKESDAFTPSPEFQEWITDVVREQLPADYEKRKNWGHTAKTFDGISVKVEDGKIKTRRKYKQANDGEWQLYRVKLKDPEEKFDIKIANIRKLADGKVGMEITATASLEVFGRQSLWQHGMQLYSLSAEADARVRLWASTEVATQMDLTRFPPDIALDPEVTAAKLEIPDFRMRRIGELQGPLVRSLSHATREALEEKLAEDNEKLVAKLNRAIDKQEKKLKLSLGDVMKSTWRELLGTPASK
jgi:hypothetical protein